MRARSTLIRMVGALAAPALLACADLAGLDESFELAPTTAGTGGSGGATSSGAPSSSSATTGGGGGGGDTGGGGSNDPCKDGKQDNDETDIDCGGSCAPCAVTKACKQASDCTSSYCAGDDVCHAIQAVAAGALHTCAITDLGEVKCWGDNTHGELGQPDGGGGPTPQDVTIPSGGAKAITAGDSFTCIRPVSGKIVCWGLNDDDQLGTATLGDYPTPRQIASNGDIFSDSAGAGHVCVATHNAGGASCWGRNHNKQLGNGSDTMDEPVPVSVKGVTGVVKSIASGDLHSCAISGSVAQCWGSNSDGQKGNDLAALTGLSKITAGALHTCALQGQTVFCWGNNDHNQLSGSSTGGPGVPNVQVSQLDAIEIAAGVAYTCAITTAHGVSCWGDNHEGELCQDPGTSGRVEPTPIAGLSDVDAISAGAHHACAVLHQSGAVVCWGAADAGQVGVTSTTPVVPFHQVAF